MWLAARAQGTTRACGAAGDARLRAAQTCALLGAGDRVRIVIGGAVEAGVEVDRRLFSAPDALIRAGHALTLTRTPLNRQPRARGARAQAGRVEELGTPDAALAGRAELAAFGRVSVR